MNKYINNLDDCLLITFKKCIKSHDYKDLLLDGEFEENEAREAWLLLYDLFNDALKSNSVSIQFNITKQIEVKKNDYMIIQNCLSVLGMIHQINLIGSLSDGFEKVSYDEYISLINGYGFRFNEKKGISKELERVKKQSNVYLSNIQSDIKRLEKLNENTKDWDFDRTIGAVDKYMGYPMPKDLSLKMFTVYYNMLIDSQTKEPKK